MGLQQPLLGDPSPSAPPLAPPPHGAPGLMLRDTPYAAASAPPGAAPGYPPYEQQQQQQQQQRAFAAGGGGGAYPAVPAHGYPAPPTHAPYAPPPVVERTTTVIYETPVIQRVTAAPVLQMCPACGHTGATRVKRERGCCTWLQCFGMCWLFCPLFWLPCCLDCSKDLVHRCSSCGAEVARISPC
ncbi:MAG: LITAF-like zinc ribbon domain-containing protein [Monoraphidium minutum]|nr:MAG: LITAF-like zinc ribbon domain-containing protein [Monoraphidium minutum]